MENSILISVVIPAYNAGDYIAQCIESLLCQSYKNLEIIVVDDGSTDNTAQIVQPYPEVKYLYQPNSGVSAARNKGLDAALGEYIHFVDADDLLTLDFYEKMMQAVIETRADMACCGFYFERTPSQSQRIEHKLVVSSTTDKILMTDVCNYGACWKYIFRVSFLKGKKLYFEEGRISGEDRIFSIQAVFFANRIVLVPEAMYIYKHRKHSVTVTKNPELVKKRHRDRKYATQFQIEFSNKHHFSLDRSRNRQDWQYKLLGLPICSKRIYHPGKIRWYFLNIPVFQKKEIDR